MVIEVTEKEMKLRFVDGLKQASSAAKQMSNVLATDKPAAMVQFLNGLKVAAGSSHQLAIYRENLKMLTIRDTLENIIEIAKDLVLSPAGKSSDWLRINAFLEAMILTGVKTADQKAAPRAEVLAELSLRQRLAGTDEEVKHLMADNIKEQEAEANLEVPYDTSNPEQVNTAKKKAARTRADRLEFVKAAMGLVEGRSWFYDLVNFCRVINTPYSDNPYDTAFKCGMQNVGLKLMEDIQDAAPEKYILMISENRKR